MCVHANKMDRGYDRGYSFDLIHFCFECERPVLVSGGAHIHYYRHANWQYFTKASVPDGLSVGQMDKHSSLHRLPWPLDSQNSNTDGGTLSTAIFVNSLTSPTPNLPEKWKHDTVASPMTKNTLNICSLSHIQVQMHGTTSTFTVNRGSKDGREAVGERRGTRTWIKYLQSVWFAHHQKSDDNVTTCNVPLNKHLQVQAKEMSQSKIYIKHIMIHITHFARLALYLFPHCQTFSHVLKRCYSNPSLQNETHKTNNLQTDI